MQVPDVQGRLNFLDAEKKEAISSVSKRNAAPLRKVRCPRCDKQVELVDEELEQCLRCNGEEIHEAARLTIFEALPSERARRFASGEDELQILEDRMRYEEATGRRERERFAP
jgi:hypothetical protein